MSTYSRAKVHHFAEGCTPLKPISPSSLPFTYKENAHMFAIGHPSPKPFLRKAQDAFRCVRKCVLQPCLSDGSSNAEIDCFQGHFPRYQTVEMKEVFYNSSTDRQCTVPHPMRTNSRHERKEESPPPLKLRLIWGLEIVKQLFPPKESQVQGSQQEAISPLQSSLPDLSEEEEVSMAYNDSYFEDKQCKSDFVRGEWISKETMEGNTMLPPGTKGENEAPRNSDAESDSLHGLKEGLRIFVAI